MSAVPKTLRAYAPLPRNSTPGSTEPGSASRALRNEWRDPPRAERHGVYQRYEPSDAERRLWQDWAALILGLGIAASPWLLGFAVLAGATMNAMIVGLLVSALAALSLTLLDRWEAWVNLGLAFWLCLSPWLMGYGIFAFPAWGHTLMGLGLAVLAISAILRGLREAP